MCSKRSLAYFLIISVIITLSTTVLATTKLSTKANPITNTKTQIKKPVSKATNTKSINLSKTIVATLNAGSLESTINKQINSATSGVGYNYSDIDGDGKIDNNDYKVVKNYILRNSLDQLNSNFLELADVDRDGKITSKDLALLKRFISLPENNVITTESRFVINGKVHNVSGYLINNKYYFKPLDIENSMLGSSKPFKTAMLDSNSITPTSVTMGNVKYVNISDVAKAMNFSCTNDTVLGAVYIWTDETYMGNAGGDFERAISLGLVSDNLKTDAERQITANEFRELLSLMISKLEPSKITQFEENVTTYNKLLMRGEGFVMAYYAAICVGADTWNNNFDPSKAGGDDFWDASGYEMDKLFPHIWEGPVKFSNKSNEWRDYYTAAFLWSFWHSSLYSGERVFEYNEETCSMGQKQPLTVKDAICATVRIYDSYVVPQMNVSLTDENAVNYDKTIITDKLLIKANTLPNITKENMPVWKGFVLSNGGSYENTDIVETGKDLQNIANWGFNSVRFMLTYRTLFDENVQSVNVSKLKKLDALIAAAIKYNLHIDILTFSLPGRWSYTDYTTYKTIGSIDLFTNPDRQKEANAVWALLSERYKDIPSATLSFCPIWEAQNYDLSSGLPVVPYTVDDVANVYNQLIETIRRNSPNRFIIFEPTPNNDSQQIIRDSQKIKDSIEGKYSDALMISNFCENPFVYAEMTAVQGNNIDNNNHSMFKPPYPTTIYATQFHVDNDSSLDMNGELVVGTKIDIYLSKIDGTGNFDIVADGKTLYSENLSTMNFKTESPLSRYYPYAKSDKLISITLSTDVKDLQIRYSGNWFEWSGIDVTLPVKYTVKRWWFPSDYDAKMYGTEFTGPVLKDTSTIMLSPNSYNSGRTITINPDITYTTPYIFAQSNKQTIENWAKQMSEFSPKLIVRFENAAFCTGCIHDSALKYYDDVLSTFAVYGISWFSNDYWSMFHPDHFYAGVKSVKYYDYPAFDVDLLKLLQKHQ